MGCDLRMVRMASSMLVASVMGAATLALSATQSSAQQRAARPIGEAQSLSGAEWAIGQWEGNVLTVGTSAGSRGLLTIERRRWQFQLPVCYRSAAGLPTRRTDEAVCNQTEWHIADHSHFDRN